jgi:hypothetical protein
MNIEQKKLNLRYRRYVPYIALTVLFSVVPFRLGFAQTNVTQTGSTQTNLTFGLPAPTDFQRLQYYYASYQNSPPPGTEHGIFTIGSDHSWSGVWNSTVVPMPSRTQLNAITPAQVDLFNRAGAYTNGSWQIVTSQTNIPLSALTITSYIYTQIRITAGRDKQLATCQQIQSQISQQQSSSP